MPDDRVQHRRRSASRPARAGARSPAAPVHARAGAPGEITSQAGWPPDTPVDGMSRTVGELQRAGIRVSLFVDPEPAAVRWAASLGADRIELYTEPFARAFRAGPQAAQRSFDTLRRGGNARARARPRHQRRPRSRPRQPRALPDAAASRRGVDRPRAHQPRAVRRAGPGRARLPCCCCRLIQVPNLHGCPPNLPHRLRNACRALVSRRPEGRWRGLHPTRHASAPTTGSR